MRTEQAAHMEGNGVGWGVYEVDDIHVHGGK